ncbi:MAG: hypothetical protein DI544_02935 [Sphingomonas taxi]|uniref:Uncharacterized protein n=1 Tax=Sphingomonas taxi TaxID=1549858 RepID=A0A2W5PAT2_9SPHN|nr:MAG: hypothetical protein DI544_02935 [Sphingomonas taxi]
MKVALVMVVLAMSASVQAEQAPSTACARLASQLKMKQGAAPRDGGKPEWSVDLLGGLGKALFGGAAASSMSVEPIADADALDYGAYTRSCVRERIEMACHVTGPARLVVATDKTEANLDLAAGETIDAGIRKGRRIYCRDVG